MGTHPTKIAMVITSLLNVAALPVANANDEMVNLAALSDVITVTGSRFERTAEQQLTLINTIEREDIAKLNRK